MSPTIRRKLPQRKHKIDHRLQPKPGGERPTPMMAAANIHYDIADRTRAIAAGGIGAIHLMAQRIGLVEEINNNLHLLKRHLPYHESDHVLAIAYNILAGGTRLEHLDIRRQDEVFLDALGAQRLPDPTTSGDFCRRFTQPDIDRLMDTINGVRLRVWKERPHDFFEEAFLDADGTLAPTGGWCKQGINVNHEGVWGYHPLLVSLANTCEPLFPLNRSANRPSHEDAHIYLDKAIALCRQAGFRRITPRGDTDFSQTKHLDRWDEAHVGFVFGIGAMANLKAIADALPAEAYTELERPARPIQTVPRQAPERHRERVVQERQFRTLKLMGEEVAEFASQPTACRRSYRVDRAEEEAGRREGPAMALRAGSFVLPHHQRPDPFSQPDRLSGQRSVRPGEPDRPAQGSGQGDEQPGGHAGEQRGLHGHGEPGLEPQGVGGVAAAGASPVA